MLILTNRKLYIDNIYWEKSAAFIEGHSEGIDINQGEFLLRNLIEN